MNTITLNAAATSVAATAGALRRFAERVAALFGRSDDDVSLSARELRAMAARYEASQPSFAADLRAAAERQQ